MSFSASKALQNRLILLSGEEDQLRSRALAEILREAGVAKDDFDLEHTAADTTAPADWLGLSSTVPFLAERRILVVRHLLRRDVDDLAGTDLAALPATALLILVADEEAVSTEDKARRLGTLRGKWERAVTAAKGHVESFRTDSKQAKEEVRKEAMRLGKSMSERAADLLLEMTGGGLSRAFDELEKLTIFVGEQEQIRETDVRDVVVPSREYNVFNLVDALTAGDAGKGLRQLRILIGSSVKAEEAAMSRIMPMISRTLRLVWQARLCVDAGCPPSKVTTEVRQLLPVKPNIVEERSYRQASLMTIAKRTDLLRIQRCMAILSDTDARLKGGMPAFSSVETMERMVLEMSVQFAGR